jgi:hypothetical protein
MSMPTYATIHKPLATIRYSLTLPTSNIPLSSIHYPLSTFHLMNTTPQGTHQPKHGISSTFCKL